MSAGTLDADLRRSAAAHPDREAVVADGRRISYAELDGQVTRLAQHLIGAGVSPGERVAVVMRNSAAAATAIYAVLRAGAAFVPVAPGTRQPRLESVLGHCGAGVVIADDDVADRLSGVAERLPGVRRVMTVDTPAAVPGNALDAVIDVDLAAILYTSGSTGEPKGAAFLHRNMHFVAASMVEFLELGGDDRILSVLPLSHTYGLYQLIMSVQVGATLVLRDGMALPGRVLQELHDERISVLPGVPTMWHMLTSLRGGASHELPSLRAITNAGAALPVPRLQAVRRIFPAAKLYSIYGQTECKSACYLPPEELDRRPGSVGIALPGTAVQVETSPGEPAGPGEVGELIIRGDHVMQGYWRDPDATARAMTPGRLPGDRELRSGDLFRQDEDGFLYFVARKDDIIMSRGEKVAPRTVEEVLLSIEGVREAVVVGVPDDLLGAAVVAHVCPDPGVTLRATALRRRCAELLEAFQVPTLIHLRDDLPRLDSGKPDRVTLAAADVPRRAADVVA